MNDEPQFDCDRENQSTAQTKIRVSTQVFSDRCFASCRCRSEDKKRTAHSGQEAAGRPARSISAWPSGSATPRIRIQASGRHTEDTWPARARRREEGRPRQGFNATEQNLDIATTLDNWQGAGDERLFKIIVSPEFADRLNLQQHTRELMQRMERDLGTQLEWVAAVHHNTEHPHVHIAVRGVDDKGMPLRLPREYIRAGMRGAGRRNCYRSPGLSLPGGCSRGAAPRNASKPLHISRPHPATQQ